jgi:hypothetical protein
LTLLSGKIKNKTAGISKTTFYDAILLIKNPKLQLPFSSEVKWPTNQPTFKNQNAIKVNNKIEFEGISPVVPSSLSSNFLLEDLVLVITFHG